MSSVLAATALFFVDQRQQNNLNSNLTRGSGCASTLDTASAGAGCCFFFLRLTAGTMSIGLSGRPFDACDQVKNERNTFTLDLSVGLLISSHNQADIISKVIRVVPLELLGQTGKSSTISAL